MSSGGASFFHKDDTDQNQILCLRREVADTSMRLECRIRSLDAHAPKTSVAGFVQRREVERVLMSQFVGDLGVSRLQLVERLGLVEPSAGCGRQLREVLFAAIEYA